MRVGEGVGPGLGCGIVGLGVGDSHWLFHLQTVILTLVGSKDTAPGCAARSGGEPFVKTRGMLSTMSWAFAFHKDDSVVLDSASVVSPTSSIAIVNTSVLDTQASSLEGPAMAYAFPEAELASLTLI